VSAKERSRRYWPTMRLVVEGNTVEISVYKENGNAIFVRKSAVTGLDEIVADVREWIERETAKP
jgi:hypothetical protein